MPIPVSATGFASAAGAQEAQQAELATSGPFARLAATPAAEPCAAVPQAAASASAPSAAVEVRNLSFWYSGLDGKPLDDCPPVVSEASFSVAPRDRVLLLGSCLLAARCGVRAPRNVWSGAVALPATCFFSPSR